MLPHRFFLVLFGTGFFVLTAHSGPRSAPVPVEEHAFTAYALIEAEAANTQAPTETEPGVVDAHIVKQVGMAELPTALYGVIPPRTITQPATSTGRKLPVSSRADPSALDPSGLLRVRSGTRRMFAVNKKGDTLVLNGVLYSSRARVDWKLIEEIYALRKLYLETPVDDSDALIAPWLLGDSSPAAQLALENIGGRTRLRDELLAAMQQVDPDQLEKRVFVRVNRMSVLDSPYLDTFVSAWSAKSTDELIGYLMDKSQERKVRRTIAQGVLIKRRDAEEETTIRDMWLSILQDPANRKAYWERRPAIQGLLRHADDPEVTAALLNELKTLHPGETTDPNLISGIAKSDEGFDYLVGVVTGEIDAPRSRFGPRISGQSGGLVKNRSRKDDLTSLLDHESDTAQAFGASGLGAMRDRKASASLRDIFDKEESSAALKAASLQAMIAGGGTDFYNLAKDVLEGDTRAVINWTDARGNRYSINVLNKIIAELGERNNSKSTKLLVDYAERQFKAVEEGHASRQVSRLGQRLPPELYQLAKMKSGAGQEFLVKVMLEHESDSIVMIMFTTLKRYDNPRNTAILVRVATTPDHFLRDQAMDFLKDSPRACQRIVEYYTKTNPEGLNAQEDGAAYALAICMSRLGDEETQTLLNEDLSHEQPGRAAIAKMAGIEIEVDDPPPSKKAQSKPKKK